MQEPVPSGRSPRAVIGPGHFALRDERANPRLAALFVAETRQSGLGIPVSFVSRNWATLAIPQPVKRKAIRTAT